MIHGEALVALILQTTTRILNLNTLWYGISPPLSGSIPRCLMF